MSENVRVRGGATDEELAAVLAALVARRPGTDQRYEQWRRGRISALRPRAGPGSSAR